MSQVYKLLFRIELAIAFVLCAFGIHFRVTYQLHDSQLCIISAAVSLVLALINYATNDFVRRKLDSIIDSLRVRLA